MLYIDILPILAANTRKKINKSINKVQGKFTILYELNLLRLLPITL